jgi:pimeloyl-ACP methyl ester carboxylesterase
VKNSIVSKILDRLFRLARPVGALAGIAGAAAVVNRGLRESSSLPRNHLGGTRRRWTWRGFEIFATELGSGPPILLVHGIYAGASSYEYRKIAPLLARRHRVIAIDLLGCGLSDMPDLSYNADLFVEQIVDALGEFFDEPVTLVGSSLGAAFCIRAAARASDRVARLVTIAPTGLAGVLDDSPTAAQEGIAALVRSPVLGESLFNALSSPPSLRWFLATMTYADPASVTPEIIADYYALTHQPGARFVAGAFVGNLLNCNVARDLPFLSAPLLVLWGERASRTNPAANAHEYLRLARDASLRMFPNSGLLPHEEEAEATAEAIETFLTTEWPAAPASVSPTNA